MTRIPAIISAWIASVCITLAQTQPAPQPLPYLQNFGSTPFSILPPGVAAWAGLGGDKINTAEKASSSNPTVDATVPSATAPRAAAGAYGLTTDSNARFYIQTSSNNSNGVNQLAIALNTIGQINVTLRYDVEIISAAPRTIGVICQYRIGTTGLWTNLPPSTGTNPFSQSGGTIGLKTSPQITLPNAATNQPIIQIRWATWRGNETGDSSGLAIDNISVTGNSSNNSLAISATPTSFSENAGTNAALVTVTTSSPTTVDLPVTLTNNDPSEAAVDLPNPTIIPAGQSFTTFNIHAIDDDLIDGPQTVTLTATAPAANQASTTLTILDDEDANSPPPNYYSTAKGLSGNALKNALNHIISAGHIQFLYSATWNPLRAIHTDPNNSSNILTVYSGASLLKNSIFFGSPADPNLTWSREHIWPVSFALDPEGINPGNGDGDAGPDFTDLFNLRPAIHAVNSARGNLFFDESTGNITIPPLAPECSKDSNSWEPREIEKGDLARSLLYMATRYDGTDPKTVDLEIGNAPNTITGIFAKLSTLLQWHENDPVSIEERRMNQLIFTTYQKNRNPFIDHPEYVALIWGSLQVSKFETSVTEGGAESTYTLKLTGQPSADVIVNISSTPISQMLASPSNIKFTPANWDTPQTITLNAVDDTLFESTRTAIIEHAITSADTHYAATSPSSIVVTVFDNDPLIAPTTLPVNHSGPWSPLPTGFQGTGIGTYTTSLGGDSTPGSAKFDDTGDRLIISFSRAPSTLSYSLKGNPASTVATTNGTFLIQESPDGTEFTTVRTVTNKNSTDQTYSDSLSNKTRFISLSYQTKTSGNIQLDNLSITLFTSPWLTWQSTFGINHPNNAAEVDSDQDGINNLAEYALGGSPITPDATRINPTTEKTPNKLRFAATLRTNDPALSSTLETSTNLTDPTSWTPSGIQKIQPINQTGIAPGFERMVFEIDDAGSTKRFVRLRFVLQ